MKRIAIFLAVTFAITWGYEFAVVYPLANGVLTSLPALIIQVSVGAVMFVPAIGVVITRLVTREGFKNSVIKPRHLRSSLPWFLVAWFGPAILFALGAAVYYLVFTQDFDPTMSTMVAQQQAAIATSLSSASGDAVAAASGTTIASTGATSASDIATLYSDDTVRLMLLTQIPIAVLFGPLLNILTTFGEEWGWRGYLVPKVAMHLRIVPTLLITGVIWGLWHAPLTAIGHSYGTGYAGAPFTGILAMCVFCIVAGIFLTYVTERTGSCLAAAFGHGAINAIASAALFFSLTGGNAFVGPSATGIIGGSAMIVVAGIMLWDLHRREKNGTLRMPQAGLGDGVTKQDRAATESSNQYA